jgi:DeoR/GlpR family transcriptional regulator of sugar metabolism
MLAVTRKSKIQDIIFEKKSVSVSELSGIFSVTEETIRRDLKALEDDGFLTRTYGGAYIDAGVQSDIRLSVREVSFVENKRRMAAACRPLIADGDSIFIDCSTTAFHLCGFIEDLRVTVLTNSLKVLSRLSDREAIRLIASGGSFRASSFSFVGKSAIQTLNSYYVDKAFISCRSVDLAHGLSHSSEQQAEIYSLMLDRAEKVYLMCDHTKLDKISFVNIGGLKRVHTIITDASLPRRWRDRLQRDGIHFIECVDSGEE